ncbi:MAG: DUF3592 domain-containing protein [Candidatus Omnitrophica bacterium]|nr:DUF3592 domain-containing protein [Candidatus Omnitrophota bacterium]
MKNVYPLSLRLTGRPRDYSRGILAFIVVVGLGIGGSLVYFMIVSPYLQANEARDWVEVPCTILSSEVESHDSGRQHHLQPAHRLPIHVRGEGLHFGALRFPWWEFQLLQPPRRGGSLLSSRIGVVLLGRSRESIGGRPEPRFRSWRSLALSYPCGHSDFDLSVVCF